MGKPELNLKNLALGMGSKATCSIFHCFFSSNSRQIYSQSQRVRIALQCLLQTRPDAGPPLDLMAIPGDQIEPVLIGLPKGQRT